MPRHPHPPPPPHALIWLDGMLTKIRSNTYQYMPFIIWTSSALFKGAVNFNYLPRKKGLEVYIVQWQVFLDGTGTLLNFFKVYHF